MGCVTIDPKVRISLMEQKARLFFYSIHILMHLGSQFLQKLSVVTGLCNLYVKQITSEESRIPDLEDLEVGSSILYHY